uniref:Uncharacterized protein n=1 Tax=Eptatretus burgeri TaxID=7764 RepID=A0A8C4R2A7_EPTBU
MARRRPLKYQQMWTQRRLFPAIFNLASNAQIEVNATCGEHRPETYCKLVEHVVGRPFRNPQCRICDLNSANEDARHPITNAIDGTNNWWQSPSIQNGMDFHSVTITLDLQQVFQVAYVILKAANSPRPGNWILERSLDNVTFKPWQYHAIAPGECLRRYGLPPSQGNPTYNRDDEVICTSFYSRLVPLENGEIHTSLINGRPSADDPSPTLLDFASARYIRLRFQRIRTLNADLMTLSLSDPSEIDPIVTRRYFYSVKDISVGGMCICYGHAMACPYDPVEKVYCECEHNTCGKSCSHCCPGYHQTSWQSGTLESGNECERCNCHGKADDCYYDDEVSQKNQSLNIRGQYIGGGVCINCTGNTEGINCETCIDGYYRPAGVPPTHPHPCHQCVCDPNGAVGSRCVKDDRQADYLNGLLPGSCYCKPGFGGERCDQCARGYRGFPACEPCLCNPAGSANLDPCEEPCFCKENVEGLNCEYCKAGHYNLQASNPKGCLPCFCSGTGALCQSIAWGTLSDMAGWHLTDAKGQMALAPSQDGFDGPLRLSVNHSLARRVFPGMYYWSAPHSYLGNKLVSYGGLLKFTISYDLPQDNFILPEPANIKVLLKVMHCFLHWTGFRRVNGTFVPARCEPCQCHGHADACDDFTGDCHACKHNTAGMHCERCQTEYYGNATAGTAHDCHLCACPLNTPSNNFSPTCHLDSSGDVVCDQCHLGYAGNRCERCAEGFYGEPSVPGGSCQRCECSGNLNLSRPGSCHPHTGACLHCTETTEGEHCEHCAPGYYGDAVNPCECNTIGSAGASCDPVTGQCVCRAEFEGTHCDLCRRGLHRFPHCMPCACDPAGTRRDTCDAQDGVCECSDPSGQCSCKVREFFKNRCWLFFIFIPKLFSFIIFSYMHGGVQLSNYKLCLKGMQMCSCFAPFFLCGSSMTADDDFHSLSHLPVQEHVQGTKCDSCSPGTFGLHASNPKGCSHCFCFGFSSECSEAQGLVRKELTMNHHQDLLEVANQANTRSTRRGVRFHWPETTVNVDDASLDLQSNLLYWKLPQEFLGHKLMAYGGQLTYTVSFEGSGANIPASPEPQVLMAGRRGAGVLAYHGTMYVAAQQGKHQIHFVEVRPVRVRNKSLHFLFLFFVKPFGGMSPKLA